MQSNQIAFCGQLVSGCMFQLNKRGYQYLSNVHVPLPQVSGYIGSIVRTCCIWRSESHPIPPIRFIGLPIPRTVLILEFPWSTHRVGGPSKQSSLCHNKVSLVQSGNGFRLWLRPRFNTRTKHPGTTSTMNRWTALQVHRDSP